MENEQKVEALYRAYAERFPAHKKLWRVLADGEKCHAEILKDLIARHGEGKEILITSPHSVKCIDYVSDFIDGEMEKSNSGAVTLEKALLSAVRIERSMIERKCFEMFKPEIKEIEEAFAKLNSETDDHLNALLKTLEKMK